MDTRNTVSTANCSKCENNQFSYLHVVSQDILRHRLMRLLAVSRLLALLLQAAQVVVVQLGLLRMSAVHGANAREAAMPGQRAARRGNAGSLGNRRVHMSTGAGGGRLTERLAIRE